MYEGDVEIKSMEKLCLLKVRFCENVNLLSAIVKKSPNLKWLDIHFSPKRIDSTMLTNQFIGKFFIDTLENLQNLRYLGMSNCNLLGSISCEYLNMMQIRELSFSNCEQLDEFLNGVDKLVTLEELCFFNCKDLDGTSIQLGNLSTLQKL